MTTAHAQLDWRGMKVVDREGAKVGSLDEVYFDQQTDQPEWAAVKTGMFGTRLSFVPLTGASSDGERVQVAYEKGQIKDAPRVDAEGELSSDEEAQLYRHYEMGDSDWDWPEAGHARGDEDRQRGQVGRDVSGPNTDEAMTRSEEELEISTSRRTAGKARLRKWVDTEPVSETVTVTRETARVSREPITEANHGDAMDGPEISSEEHEVTLSAEVPVVEKRTVAKERIGVDKETVREEQTVSEELRKERIDVEGDIRR